MTRWTDILLLRRAQVVLNALLLVGLLPQLCAAQEADPLDEALLKQLENPDASSHSDVFSRLVEHTRSVQVRLADQQLDRQTQDLQAKVLDDFDRLLEQLDATSPASPEGSPPPAQQGASQAASAAAQDPMHGTSNSAQPGGQGNQGQTDPNAAAGQSAERSTAGR